jgi:hypothetical protein
MCENWTDYLTMEELNFNPENQIKIWLTNIIFYGIEDLLNGKEVK